MLLFPVLTLSARLVAPNMRSCGAGWGIKQTNIETTQVCDWSNHDYVNCLIDATNDKKSNDFASYFFFCLGQKQDSTTQ